MYHPLSEKLVDILCTKTQNQQRLFFRSLLAYYWGVCASQLRASVVGFGGGKAGIPINVYALCTSPSGTGKGFSTSLMENEVLALFKKTYYEEVFPVIAESSLDNLALQKAGKQSLLYNDCLDAYTAEFIKLGSPLFVFGDATTPATKQLRQKLLMANTGSLNLQSDEIGSNLLNQKEVLTTFLELYDKGYTKDKLLKSSKEDIRFEKIDGSTPANMLLFGTPSKLLDGGVTEQTLFELLETGYARRCIFGCTSNRIKPKALTAEDLYEQMFSFDTDTVIEEIAEQINSLCTVANNGKQILISKEVCIELLRYKLQCEEYAKQFKEHEVIFKSEADHRYFKVLKIAGAYAFIDGLDEITSNHLQYAITLVEDSAKAFRDLMSPERPYIKLAKYLAGNSSDLTLADLDNDLPYFKGSRQQKEELITLATAWGYKNNVIIKKSVVDGIHFLKGETLQETNLDEIILSYSKDITEGYRNVVVPFDKLCELVSMPNRNWLSHHLVGGNTATGYRKEENCIGGFNLLVLDVDGGTPLSTAKELLSKYTYLIYTTKRHMVDSGNGEVSERYRIILPINYQLVLDAKEYKEFYNSIVDILPIEVDTQCNQRSRKWLSNPHTQCTYNEGELFDVLPYIPKTKKNDERQTSYKNQSDLDNLERWVMYNTGDGNRNNQLYKYAMILVDNKLSYSAIEAKVSALNAKLPDSLSEEELSKTIMVSVAKKVM